jgi:ornithine carbamoyltransferase
MKRDLVTILDLSRDEILALIALARSMKEDHRNRCLRRSMLGKTLALIFVKPSTRTRVSFEAAMYRLGGQCIFLAEKDTQMARQETLADTARVLSRYVEGIVVRTFAHADVEELARNSSIPVINGLTDLYHPCQVLSDLVTIEERRGSLEGLRVAWVGDGNNVAHSWINAASQLGFEVTLACPRGYEPQPAIVERALQGGGAIRLTDDPASAVVAADVIYTDVWASMGQESEAEARRQVFRPFQVNSRLLAAAPPHALVLHCLPAHRGEEITDAVMDGPQSVVMDQAENRIHFQMALLDWLIR